MGTEFREDPFGGLAGELLDVRGAEPDVLIGGGQERSGERDWLGEPLGDAADDGAARDLMRAEQGEDFRVAVQGGQSGGVGGGRPAGGAAAHRDVVLVQGAQHQRRCGVQVCGDLGTAPLPLLVQLTHLSRIELGPGGSGGPRLDRNPGLLEPFSNEQGGGVEHPPDLSRGAALLGVQDAEFVDRRGRGRDSRGGSTFGR